MPGGADFSSTSMAVALKALSETDRDVFITNNVPTALKHLPEFRSSSVKASSDLALYTAKTIQDADIVHNLRLSMDRAGIPVINEATGYVQVPSSNVGVVTGHRDRSMADHLRELKEAGVLREKVVAVISCYEEGVEGLQSDLA